MLKSEPAGLQKKIWDILFHHHSDIRVCVSKQDCITDLYQQFAFHLPWATYVNTRHRQATLNYSSVIAWPEHPPCPRARLHDRQIKSVLGMWEMPGQITPYLHSNGAFDKALATGSLISGLAAQPRSVFSSPLLTAMILRRSFKLEIITH